MPANPYIEDPRAIYLHCEARQELGQEISEECARAIAAQWHGGQGSAFYAFASSGHYDRAALLRELSLTIEASYSHAAQCDRLAMDMFGTYLLNRD